MVDTFFTEDRANADPDRRTILVGRLQGVAQQSKTYRGLLVGRNNYEPLAIEYRFA